MRDNLHGNTPLHWALLAKNLHAVAQLVTKFNADVDAVNLQGHSCVDLFKIHVKKAREQRLAKITPGNVPTENYMFFPRKVAEKFEANLPDNWLDGSKPHTKYTRKYCPKFLTDFFADKKVSCTGKSFSEALILASTNPQYDKRLFIDLSVQYMKTASSEHRENMLCTQIGIFFLF